VTLCSDLSTSVTPSHRRTPTPVILHCDPGGIASSVSPRKTPPYFYTSYLSL